MSEEMVTITKERYEELLRSDLWTDALYDAGVVNWSEFEYAIKIYQKKVKDQGL